MKHQTHPSQARPGMAIFIFILFSPATSILVVVALGLGSA